MCILDRSKPAAAPLLAPPSATQVHNLIHPIHVNFLEPQLVVPPGEHVVRRPKVSSDGIIVFYKCELERTCRGPGEVIPQQGEVHPHQPGRVGQPTQPGGDAPPGFILGRESHGQGPRLPGYTATLPSAIIGGMGECTHGRLARSWWDPAAILAVPSCRHSSMTDPSSTRGTSFHVNHCRGRHPRPTIAATVLHGTLGNPQHPVDDHNPHRVFVRQQYQLVAAQARRASRTTSVAGISGLSRHHPHACHGNH